MDVVSLGYRTDLALLQLGGTVIEDRVDHLVVRTPHNPGHWWGNFLLLREAPAEGAETDRWLEMFAAAFPDARHRAFGVDGRSGTLDDLAGFAGAGLHVEAQAVMTAASVHPPERPNGEATCRSLENDADWAQSVELRVACSDGREAPATFAEFSTRRAATHRALVEGDHGAWFGAFIGDRLVSQMGLFSAGAGLARFQSVETDPEFRGRGLAGTLVHHVASYGFEVLGAQTLVMVADPTYVAIRVYRSVGFADTEQQLQAEQPP